MDDQPRTLPKPIIRLPFDDWAVEEIATVLGVPVSPAPFRMPGCSVYQLTVENALGLPATLVTLWPAIHRVDAISPSAAVVFTDVRTVDLVDGVEVQFRRSNREMLIVARIGKVIVRA